MSIMFKPLSLVISKTSQDIERNSFLNTFAFVSKDGPRNNAQEKDMQYEHRLKRVDVLPSTKKPRCIKSYRSDRMAIYDEQRDTFHAYSVTEAISQSGLSFQEAVDWIDDRLVLVGNGMTPGNFLVAMSLILGSWAVAILLVSMVIRIVF